MIATLRNGMAALACALISTFALAQTADISVGKTGPGTATAGSNVTYTITLTNIGTDPATTITLTDPIPQGMTFVSMVVAMAREAAVTVATAARLKITSG